MKILWCITVIFLTSFYGKNQLLSNNTANYPKDFIQNQDAYARYDSLFNKHKEFIVTDFDFPVGKPNATGYYNAQKFKENNHLGDDWNGVGGGNSDLGDAIYSIANGYVSFAEDIGGGWGNVIRIIHKYKGNYYESVYAHCQSIKVKEGDFLKKGTLIATIGNANGQYLAHLHLELRDDIFMSIGGGYSENTKGYLDPTKFIKEH
ncbi:M23 family metallopeptidase [uncultured Aquimarina sp.]|uniref:M23 family metallopeptidase n=1 Tax=uncultured Aquimarina sp. TaxID=575652 RepID=UPI002639DC4B|nr:M23 family metallopeptidase [uncultured Aquimarina sp.]